LRKRKVLLTLIAVTTLLLLGTVSYNIWRGDDHYKYFTGLGENFDISPDDQQYIFSYYTAGKEAIYQTNANGEGVTQLTKPTTERHHAPRYSPDGKKILFLAQNSVGINSLFVANRDGSQQKQLTTKKLHVSEAIFSPTENTIYYIGMKAADFKKAEGETKEGYDLYSTQLDGKNSKQLTDKDQFSMNSLSISPDGKELYYGLYTDNGEKLTAYSLENGEESIPFISKMNSQDGYGIVLSPDGNRVAYTGIAKESLKSSLYTYELFFNDLKNGQTKRLTNLHTNVTSPRFFHNSNQIAFLENTNWPAEPAKYALRSIDLGTQKKVEKMIIAMPDEKPGYRFLRIADQLANGTTLTVIYSFLVGLLTTYQFYFHSKRRYLPIKISLFLAAAVFIASIIFAIRVSPWYGIGLGMAAAAILVGTLIVFVFAFVWNKVKKRS
jgi:Tol biopolymer transport system component